jgi:uncharacterized protein
MRLIFADTFYWAASINPGDNWHKKVLAVTATLNQIQIVTTDEVLIEVLNFFSSSGSFMRQNAVSLVNGITGNSNVQVVPQTHESFKAGLVLYEHRLDKGYSLTDCISMNTMNHLRITEVLTHDQHLTQEGFTILLRDYN